MRRGGVRLDRTVADELGCGRREARKLLRCGRILLDGRTASPATIVFEGQRIAITADPADAAPRAPSRRSDARDSGRDAGVPAAVGAAPGLHPDSEPVVRPIRLLWESADLLVLDKAAGVHTHGGRSRTSVADALAEGRPELLAVGPAREAGVVHRLDRDTSGVLLVAKDATAYAALRAAFKSGCVVKEYLALVAGDWSVSQTIDRPLARRRTRVVPARRHDRALAAVSAVAPLERGGEWSLVRVTIATGVTHQVRAHLALGGHPILGDARYGGPPAPAAARAGQLLHALAIALPDGRAFAAPAPADFVRALWSLRSRSSD